MRAHALLFSQLGVLAVLGVLHVSALEYSLYWHYVWLDTLSHFLGGVWAALAFVWLLSLKGYRPATLVVVGAVLVIGAAWELFEVVAGIPRETTFILDTTIDMCMDLFGGIVGVWWARTLVRT